MASGLADFKYLLAEFRGLSVGMVGSAVAVPFAAALVELSPPWPPGILLVTAILELLALILAFQFFKSAKRAMVNWTLAVSVLLLFGTSTIYLVMLSLYTYQVPSTKDRFVKGYDCTSDAKLVFKERCPNLGLDEIKTAEYDAERLWTLESITFMRTAIVLLWSIAFVALSFSLGNFLGYQMRIPGRRRRT